MITKLQFFLFRCGWQSYKTNEPNPIVLEGALVGGPNQNDQFEDDRKNVKQSEVALDYNAGFQVSFGIEFFILLIFLHHFSEGIVVLGFWLDAHARHCIVASA